jgi:hypothetical protein
VRDDFVMQNERTQEVNQLTKPNPLTTQTVGCASPVIIATFTPDVRSNMMESLEGRHS